LGLRERAAALDDLPRHTHHHRVRGDGLHDDGVRADAAVLPDDDVAEDLRARADDHTVTQRRVALAPALEAGAAERHPVVQRAVLTDHGGLADDDAHAVVDEEARPDLRAGVDLNAGQEASDLRDGPPQQLEVVFPQPVCDPVGPDGVQAGVQEHDLQRTASRRVTLHEYFYIAPDGFKHNRYNLLS